MNFISIKNFCAKDVIKKVKRKLMEWEIILSNHVSDKKGISRIYKECLQLNNKKTNPILK